MSSSRRRLAAALLALALVGATTLAGCSGLRPVYGDNGVLQGELALTYAKPASRLDQIIIQDLALRLGRSDDPDAALVTISASAGAVGLTRTNVVKPEDHAEAIVNASYTVVSGGRVVAQGSRSATAGYATRGQVLADTAALKEAQERAARAVAETIRLSLMAQLGAGAGL